MLETLIAAFETVEDPRCEWKVEHRLLDILVIAVCAVPGEAESFEDIALYGRCEREWLEGFLELPYVTPGCGPAAALVTGSLRDVLRGTGVLVPGALGIQEGGLVLVRALSGIP